jgi:hypothetical protein
MVGPGVAMPGLSATGRVTGSGEAARSRRSARGNCGHLPHFRSAILDAHAAWERAIPRTRRLSRWQSMPAEHHGHQDHRHSVKVPTVQRRVDVRLVVTAAQRQQSTG